MKYQYFHKLYVSIVADIITKYINALLSPITSINCNQFSLNHILMYVFFLDVLLMVTCPDIKTTPKVAIEIGMGYIHQNAGTVAHQLKSKLLESYYKCTHWNS